MGVFTSWKLHR